jgi:hypothetical protein
VFSPQLDDHAIPVDGFQQSGSESPMDLDSAAYDSLSQCLDFCSSGAHVRCGSTKRADCFSKIFGEESSEVGSICHGTGRMALENRSLKDS